MVGFWKRFFGDRKTTGAQAASATEVVGDSARAAESNRVERIDSPRFRPSARPRAEGDVGDTGPWFIGKTVGEIYQIRRVLGWGGMGIVYGAYDTATQRDIAVKVPLGKFVDDEGQRKRFTREAETWSGLIHPHIVHAFDVRDDQTTDYRPAVCMDYCDGGSLAERLRVGSLISVPDALDIAIQVCWAMEFAHERGLIHRDLKPGNVLLTQDGKALVSDFGLVKVLDLEELQVTQEEWEEQDEAGQASLTRGLAMGTPEYMPPEQWKGQACKQSDIYALGIMLYELFCGGRPFTAESRAALWIPHSKVAPPDPRQLNGQVPAVLAEVMVACLRKEPSARPSSFGAVAERLSESYRHITGKAHSSRRAKPSASELSREQRQDQAWALIRLGIGCQLRGDLDEAMRHYFKARDIFREIGDQGGLSASLGNLANVLGARGDLDGAMQLHKEDERICRELGNKNGLSGSLGNQAVILKARGDLDGAMKLLKEVGRICRELGDKDGLSICLGGQANVLYARGDLDGAMKLHQEEERICRELGNKDGLSRSLGNQAAILTARGDLDRAMQLYKEDERICRELGKKNGLQRSLGGQAVILGDRGDLDGAMQLYEEDERICRELGNKAELQACLGNQANILYARGDLDRATKLYKEKEQICNELGNKGALQDSLGGQAVILQTRGDLDGAMQLHREEERICRELGNTDGLQRSLGNQALIFQARGDLDGAMKFLKEQERICRELANPQGIATSLINQACVLALEMGRSRDALPLAEEARRLAATHGLAALEKQIKTILDHVTASSRMPAPPEKVADNIWMDLLPGRDQGERSKWIGSDRSGKAIVRSRKPSSHISEFLRLIEADQVFRRALLALPDALETLEHDLHLRQSDMRTTCLLALLYERNEQRKGGHLGLELWGSRVVRRYAPVESVEHLNALLAVWKDEFLAEYGPDS